MFFILFQDVCVSRSRFPCLLRYPASCATCECVTVETHRTDCTGVESAAERGGT